jgi:phosphopantothenoylcysteine decarboxylase/phosphopantothenate--cysteine ligase
VLPQTPTRPMAHDASGPVQPRLLLTAGPTHEPIDEVRYLANRSSGRLGIALAEGAAARGWSVTLLLGPTSRGCSDTRVQTHRFRTTADLESLLHEHLPDCDALVMAAAVADYRPVSAPTGAKIRRSGERMSLELESTPDLLAGCSRRRRPEQLLVGFALEPRRELDASARRKLERKGVDLIVANPLETMDADSIEATLYGPDGVVDATGRPILKVAFADWLLDRIGASVERRIAAYTDC